MKLNHKKFREAMNKFLGISISLKIQHLFAIIFIQIIYGQTTVTGVGDPSDDILVFAHPVSTSQVQGFSHH